MLNIMPKNMYIIKKSNLKTIINDKFNNIFNLKVRNNQKIIKYSSSPKEK